MPILQFGEVSLTEYKDVIDEITGTFTDSNLADVLVYGIGACIVLVFTWWAARKVAGMVKKAFMRGKLRF